MNLSAPGPARAYTFGKQLRRLLLIGALAASLPLLMPSSVRSREGTFQGRHVREWVREALNFEEWENGTNAQCVVATQLRGEAVPYIVQELRRWPHSKSYMRLYSWQLSLVRFLNVPPRYWLVPEPADPRGAVSAAASILTDMGEPARPAFADLARCLRRTGLHLWERLDVARALIFAGPVASGALPVLREYAADSTFDFSVQAALAIYTIEGTTNTLASVLKRELSAPGAFGSFETELWWFREDDTVQEILLPLICPLAADPKVPPADREWIVSYLGDVKATNTLPRTTLEALLESNTDPEFGEKIHEALNKLRNPGEGREAD